MSLTTSTTVRKLPPNRLGSLLLGKEELELVSRVLSNKVLNRYYLGPNGERPTMVATLEKEFGEWLDMPYCLGVTSGTAALEISLAAMGIGPGDEVIIPGWSWRSCYTAVVRVGALPVLAEIDGSLCIAPSEIDRLSTKRTKAVMVVHFQGASADMPAIMKAAARNGIKVLEDCAESPGARCKGKLVGTFADISIFSFQHQKMITSGEGGLIATRDPRLYEQAVRVHDLGNYRPYHETVLKPEGKQFAGAQYRMSELTGAVALAQFRKLPKMLCRLRNNFERVRNAIDELAGISLRPMADPSGDIGYEMYLVFATPEATIYFRKAMAANGIPCAPLTGTYPHYKSEYVHEGTAIHPAFAPSATFTDWPAPGYREEDFPVSKKILECCTSLTFGSTFSAEDIDHVIQIIRKVHINL